MRRRSTLLLVIFAVSVLCGGVSESVTSEMDIDPAADHLLKQMSRKLSAAKSISFHIEADLDVTNEGGLRYQISRSMDVALRRPDRLVTQMAGDEGNRGFRYNGRTATIYHIDLEVYSVAEVPPTIDAALDMLYDKHGFTFPLADLIHEDSFAMLMEGVMESYYLGIGDVDDVECHHLLFIQPDSEWEMWIEDSIWQYPRKILIRNTEEDGVPQYEALLSEWDCGAGLTDDIFEFDPPSYAMQIRWMERAK